MKHRSAIITVVLFVIGVTAGYAKGNKVDSSTFKGKSKQEAAKALLELAKVQAGKGSWERIAVGRVYYLGGMKAEGQAIFDDVLGRKHDPSDTFRVARIYREAGEWAKAKPLFDDYAKQSPKDDKGLAEIGSYYLLNGDRAGAEELFSRSFGMEAELWNTVSAAGAYLGIAPQE
ncbi:MAG TPA: tetratricopeptide repeat protein [Thermoanaerobaculia bacterium]|nr:tetratricopeptide repeat protein [Thermoanaerobaculia bacterium]